MADEKKDLTGYKQRGSHNLTADEEQILYAATVKKGGKLTRAEIRRALGHPAAGRQDDYKALYEAYRDDIAQDIAAKEYAADNAQLEAMSGKLAEMFPGFSTVTNEQGLNQFYQQYLDALNAVTETQYATAMDELARAENEMYRAVGLSQRQMERDIAKRRQQALKSGMSTAQLAAQEQQNILTAQAGATAIAQQYANDRYSTINKFAGVGQQNYATALSQQMQGQQGWASAMAEMFPQIYASNQYKDQ